MARYRVFSHQAPHNRDILSPRLLLGLRKTNTHAHKFPEMGVAIPEKLRGESGNCEGMVGFISSTMVTVDSIHQTNLFIARVISYPEKTEHARGVSATPTPPMHDVSFMILFCVFPDMSVYWHCSSYCMQCM